MKRILSAVVFIVTRQLGYANAEAGASATILVIDHPQFYSQKINACAPGLLSVALRSSVIQLPDRKVVSKSIGSSVASVYTPQVTTTPTSSEVKALPGKLAFLYTRQNCGSPDRDAGLNRSPLVVVDGVPRTLKFEV